MSSIEENIALANRFAEAVQRGDVETVANCYTKDAVIWHNTDEHEQDLSEQIEALRKFIATFPHREFQDFKVNAFPGGYVAQQTFYGRMADGREVWVPACVVCTVRDGKVSRLDEYADSASAGRQRNR